MLTTVTLKCLPLEVHSGRRQIFNPFPTNVPLTDKPGSWLLLAKCLKNTCGRVAF